MPHDFFGPPPIKLDEENAAQMMRRKSTILNRALKGTEILPKMADVYELMVSWIGPGHGNELSTDTVAALSLLSNSLQKKFPVLSVTLDKAHLSSVAQRLHKLPDIADDASTSKTFRPRLM